MYVFALLGFFVNHVIGPLADYTVSFFGWSRISEIGQLKKKKQTNDLLGKKFFSIKKHTHVVPYLKHISLVLYDLEQDDQFDFQWTSFKVHP